MHKREPDHLNMDMFIQLFENHLKLEKGRSQNTLNSYLSELNRFKRFIEEKYTYNSLLDIDFLCIESFLAYLVVEVKLNELSLCHNISCLRSFFRFLESEDMIKSNPAGPIDLPKVHPKLPQVLTIEEIELIIEAIPLNGQQLRNKAIIEVLYSCGLRVSELISLQLKNIHHTDGFINIIGKGNKERWVPIGNHAYSALLLYLKEERMKLLGVKPDHGFIFINRRGEALTRQLVFSNIKHWAALAGIHKSISPHTFRHTFATHLLDGGADLIAVRDLLGHVSLNTTQIYLHTTMKKLQEVVRQYHPRQ